MTQVKICGLKRPADALTAAEAGATMIGLVFYPASHRFVTLEIAADIASAARQNSSISVVGVFVNADVDAMNETVRVVGLDYVQLSGHEGDEIIDALDVPVIRTIHMDRGLDSEVLTDRILGSPAELVLLDTSRAGVFGGTGEAFDWSRVPAVDRPLLLAGGLDAGNVGQAVRLTGAWGVDVSSGVETEREKDSAKIRAFVRAACGF